MEKYKISKFAKLLNVSTRTLRRWDNDGKLTAYRTPSGDRFYTEEQYKNYMGIPMENQICKNVIYARVSNIGQKDDLNNQIEFLKQFINAKGIICDEIITDIGSGLNYKRKNWNKLLDMVSNKEVSKIYVTFKDRFVRFGFDWFYEFCKKNNCEIIIVNNEKLSPNEELVQDLISIIHVFSCRIYGLRKYKSKIKEDDSLC